LAVFEGLKFRSTSVASDEALCPAAPLDLDVGKIARTDASAGMETFWELLPAVPFQVLYYERKPIDKQGFRRPPRSFPYSDSGVAILIGSYQGLTHAETSAGFKMRWGRWTPKGFLSRLLGSSSQLWEIPLETLSSQGTNTEPRTAFRSQVENAVSARCSEEFGSFDPSLVHGVAKLALPILWSNDILPESADVSDMEILVAIYEEENGVKYLKRLSTASATHLDRARNREIISYLDNGYPRWGNSNPYTPVDVENGLVNTTRWVRTSLRQKWCID
jgi:hypothetical protein